MAVIRAGKNTQKQWDERTQLAVSRNVRFVQVEDDAFSRTSTTNKNNKRY